MLLGEYRHTLDAKCRVFVPAKMRADLGEKFYLARFLDDCIGIYPEETMLRVRDSLRDKSSAKTRDFQRFFFASAEEVTPDSQGRIVIPQTLRQQAGIEKDVVIVGVNDRAEIWSIENWDKASGRITPEEVEAQMLEFDL